MSISADLFTQFVIHNADTPISPEGLTTWKKLVVTAKNNEMNKYREDTVRLAHEKLYPDGLSKKTAFEKSAKFDVGYVRLFGNDMMNNDNYNPDLCTYATQLKDGVDAGMNKFPQHMAYPSGFIAVIFYYQYLTCLVIDMNTLHDQHKITDAEMWETQWLFFNTANRWDEQVELDAKKKEILKKCEEAARNMRQ